MVAIYKTLCISPDVIFLNIVSLSHKTTFCILLNILFTSSCLNKTLMSLVNCFIPPPKHQITKGTLVTLYCSRLLYNLPIAGIFAVFQSSSWGCLIHMDIAVFVVLIRCSQSQRSLYPFLWITLPFVQFSFHHFVSGESTPLLTAHRTANTFSALSCCQTYSVLANFWQPARRCCTVSFCFWHNRH